jgi:hypothetical protein
MATEIREDSLNSGSLQSGLGAPTHLASTGTLFTDKTTGTVYVNKNGSNLWSNISTTGSTSGGGGTITSFGYTTANNTFSIVESGVTYSATINSMSGLTISGSFTSSGTTRLANSSSNKVLIGATPVVGSYSGGTIPDGLTINSDSGGISFLRPTDYAQMVVLKAIDSSTLRIGGGNQNNVDIYGHTTAIARFSNSSGGRLGILTTSPQYTLDVSGDTRIVSGLTATNISATTYQNLPVTADTFVTGFTLSSNTITLRQNRVDQYSAFTISLSAYTGSSTSVSGAFLPLSGGTVSGRTIFTGGLTANTISATTITGSLNGTASLATNIASAVGTDNRILYQFSPNKTETSANLTWDGSKLVVKGDVYVDNIVYATDFSGITNTISSSKGSVITDGRPTNAFISIGGSNTIGGTDYVDFIRVTNTAPGATNITKTFRVNLTGGIEIIDDKYTSIIFSLTDAGVLSTPGGGTSDKRLKNNIEYISGDSSSIILKLKPAKFEFNKYVGIKRHGFIAQDVLETTPELVLGDGEKKDGVYGLDYDGILALTVKSLQEALIKINDLEIKIKELKAK